MIALAVALNLTASSWVHAEGASDSRWRVDDNHLLAVVYKSEAEAAKGNILSLLIMADALVELHRRKHPSPPYNEAETLHLVRYLLFFAYGCERVQHAHDRNYCYQPRRTAQNLMAIAYSEGLLGLPKDGALHECWARQAAEDAIRCDSLEIQRLSHLPTGRRPAGFP